MAFGMRFWLVVGLVGCVLGIGILLPTHVSAAPLSIINGADVPAGEQAWVVGILQAAVSDDYLAQFCGGTLIAPQWVLTAAHCTFDEEEKAFQAVDLHILIGRRALRDHDGKRLSIDQIIRHPAFDVDTNRHDIALLHLTTAAASATVDWAPASVPIAMDRTIQGMVVGWGVTQAGIGANILQRAQVPLVATEACRRFYATHGIMLDNNVLCAGYEAGGVDACVGDSGGPLLVWNSKQQAWVQIGIISWGSGCAEAGVYGVYTAVANFTEWIDAIIR